MNIRKALRESTVKFEKAGLKTPVLDAEVLLGFVLKKSKAWLYAHPEEVLTPQQEKNFRKLVARRARKIPVAYLRAIKEFYGLKFKVTPDVLIPRPETEILVEAVVKRLQATNYKLKAKIADIGTGSGNIAVALAKHLPQARIYATDISAAALKVARENARAHKVSGRVKFFRGDLLCALPEKVDLIAANLPYLTARQYAKNRPNLKAEPEKALMAGPDGFSLYRRLFGQITAHIALPGQIFIEIDPSQKSLLARAVQKRLPGAKISYGHDLAGKTRVAVISLPGPESLSTA